MSVLDCAVIGGGPAGLSAALVLGRSRKRVAVFDGGTPRNATAGYIGGFITQDRITPVEFRRVAHADLRAYPSVDLHLDTTVTRIERASSKLRVHAGRTEYEARRVLLATGIYDEPFPLDGSRQLWGTSLFACPYCHGYEVRDRRLAFLAPDAEQVEWVQVLRSWSGNVMLFTNAAFTIPAPVRLLLAEARIPIEERRILALRGTHGQLESIVVEGNIALPRDALFFRPQQRQTPLVSALAVALDDQGYVRVDGEYRTSIPNLHAAGDLTSHYHGAMAAASAGSKAAHCINRELTLDLVRAGLL
jgi:thioredoxin reductase